ncbi:MAG: hypothetical protein V3U80_00680 [Flavobacteriaceae bacterium]
MSALGLFNYYYFVFPKKFLNYNFKKDRKGTIAITIFVLVIFINTVVSSNYNRTKIFKMSPIEQIDKKPSLEGKVRKWFKDNF